MVEWEAPALWPMIARLLARTRGGERDRVRYGVGENIIVEGGLPKPLIVIRGWIRFVAGSLNPRDMSISICVTNYTMAFFLLRYLCLSDQIQRSNDDKQRIKNTCPLIYGLLYRAGAVLY